MALAYRISPFHSIRIVSHMHPRFVPLNKLALPTDQKKRNLQLLAMAQVRIRPLIQCDVCTWHTRGVVNRMVLIQAQLHASVQSTHVLERVAVPDTAQVPDGKHRSPSQALHTTGHKSYM